MKERLFKVVNASRTRFVSVWAMDAASATDKATPMLRKGSKLSAFENTAVKQGGDVARAVHANRGVESAYRKQLQKLISEMQGSFEYWLTAAYKKEPPRVAKLVAEDASPSQRIQKILADLAKRWIKKFDDSAPDIADAYMRDMFKSTDSAMRAALKAAGWTVEFKMTPAMRDAFNASLNENISLIKSIPSQYAQQVEGAVMRSYSAGRDLATMTKDIRAIYPVTQRRAELIARDQSNKANAVVNRTRQMELGITKAKWMHSHGGKEPRQSHVDADGTIYDIAKGCKIDGAYISPGELINCRCTSRPILPF